MVYVVTSLLSSHSFFSTYDWSLMFFLWDMNWSSMLFNWLMNLRSNYMNNFLSSFFLIMNLSLIYFLSDVGCFLSDVLSISE